ncbi:radical SAM protein [Candidatus Sumerlaeota bacterium]|nr:radical SAM protein [Candidatus Sumerlaeota bacterium]
MEGIVCVTYRCNARCHMCHTWQHPTRPEDEISPGIVDKLPDMAFTNITGGEPFLRDDVGEFVERLRKKSRRIVVSTNGYFTEKIADLARRYPDVGVRISIEGLPAANDELRGLRDGFDHGLRTLLELREMGLRDIGFGITVSDRNAKDLMELYYLAKGLGVEFATAATHNSYYFHKFDNRFEEPEAVAAEFECLAEKLLDSRRIKDWFRAYFNYGLANFVRGGARALPCEVGTDVFFLDPLGAIRPCNGMDEVLGNLNDSSFDEIWNGPRADEVRRLVRECSKQCWMIGSVSPAMKKKLSVPVRWIVSKKADRVRKRIRRWMGKPSCKD